MLNKAATGNVYTRVTSFGPCIFPPGLCEGPGRCSSDQDLLLCHLGGINTEPESARPWVQSGTQPWLQAIVFNYGKMLN